MWALVWFQLVSGMPLEYFQISSYESRTVCEQVKQRADILVTKTSMLVACIHVGIKE